MATPEPIRDPWAVSATRKQWVPPSPPVRAVAAWALSLGVVAQVWIFGGQSWTSVLLGAGLSACMAVALRVRRGRGPIVAAVRLVALAGLTVLASVPLGRTPAVLLLVVLVVADGALVSWKPFSSWPTRRHEVVHLAIGLLVAAQVLWCRGGSLLWVLGLVGTAAVLVEAAGRFPEVTAVTERAVGRAIRFVVTAIIAVVLFMVCSVFIYLPGFIHRLVTTPMRAARIRRRSTSWVARTATAADARRDVLRSFVSTDQNVRNRRTLSGLALVGVVAVLAAAWVRTGPSNPEPNASAAIATVAGEGPTDPGFSPPDGRRIFATELDAAYSALPAYSGVAFANDLQQEEAQRGVDANFEGTYVNVRDGYRVTTEPEPCDCPTTRLWFSGGSAAFGTGQRDDHTISSELVRLAAQNDGIRLEVENVSHDGYTFQMEWEWEVEQRLRTEDPPDLLVFFNGWNDSMAELTATFLEGVDPDRALSIVIPADLAAVNDRTDEFLASDIGVDAGHRSADRYRRIQTEVDAAAIDHDVQVSYFFQPDALVSTRQIESYEQITGVSSKEMLESPLAVGTATMAADLQGTVRDLRPLFAQDDQAFFLGLVHQPERAATVVAQEIYQRLRADIVARAR